MFNYDINKKGAIEENTENKTEQQSTDYVMEIGLKDKWWVVQPCQLIIYL